MGISYPTLAFANLIYGKLEPYLEKFVQLKLPKKHKIKIKTDEISQIWKDNLLYFLELPISEIHINLTYKYTKKTKKRNFMSTGGAYGFDTSDKNSSFLTLPNQEIPKYISIELEDCIVAKIDLELEITKDFKISELWDLKIDFMGTIVHELNHILEHYYRYLSGCKEMNIALSFAGSKNYNLPKSIWKIWNEFTYMVYYSEPQEIRAMSQEMFVFRYFKPIEQLKSHSYYVYANKMENFTYDIFYGELVDEIKKYKPEKVNSILRNLSKWFFNDYYRFIKEFNHTPIRSLKKETDIKNLMKKFQKRINVSGKKLKRNFVRLYSIDCDTLS